MLALFSSPSLAFAPPTSVVVSRPAVHANAPAVMSEELPSRRELFTNAGVALFTLGALAPSAHAAGMAAPRKANQAAIGVSDVKIPAKGEGSPGAGNPPVKLDTSGWSATAVISPDGKGSSNSWSFRGGESPEEKAKLMTNLNDGKGPFTQMLAGGQPGAGRALTDKD